MRFILFLLCLASPFYALGQNYKSVSDELEVCYDLDQSIRDSLVITIEKYGFNSQKHLQALQLMNKQDSINQEKVFRIMSENGWLTPPIVSKKASKAFFYIIQHLKIGEQIGYKDSVENAFKKGVISPEENAIFIDRMLIGQQKYQLYGTQTYYDQSGNLHFYPIYEFNNVNERRASLDLLSLNKDEIDTYKYHDNCIFNKIFIFHLRNIDGTNGIPNVEIFYNKNKIGVTNDSGYSEVSINEQEIKNSLTINLYKGKYSIKYPVPSMNNIDFVSIYVNLEWRE